MTLVNEQNNEEPVDVTNSGSVAKKIGQSLLAGLSNTFSNGRGVLREVGRSMLANSFAAAGSNAAINSGDPTYAMLGQKTARAVDNAIQKHWWIDKAQQFEKEKLGPAKAQIGALNRDFNSNMSNLQARMYELNTKYSPQKEQELQAVLEDNQLKFDRGELVDEASGEVISDPKLFSAKQAEVRAMIAGIANERETERSKLMTEYSALMNNYNTAYGELTMGIINDASTYDPQNPILGQIVRSTVGVIQSEAESITSTLSRGQEASDFMLQNQQDITASAAAPTVYDLRREREGILRSKELENQGKVAGNRINEARAEVEEGSVNAKIQHQENTARTDAITAQEAEDDLQQEQDVLFNQQTGQPKVYGDSALRAVVREKERVGNSPLTIITSLIQDPRIIEQVAPSLIAKETDRIMESLGYIVGYDEERNPIYNKDLTNEKDAAQIRAGIENMVLAKQAAKHMRGVVDLGIGNPDDQDVINYLHMVIAQEGGGSEDLQGPVTFILDRLAKEGIRLPRGERDVIGDPENDSDGVLDKAFSESKTLAEAMEKTIAKLKVQYSKKSAPANNKANTKKPEPKKAASKTDNQKANEARALGSSSDLDVVGAVGSLFKGDSKAKPGPGNRDPRAPRRSQLLDQEVKSTMGILPKRQGILPEEKSRAVSSPRDLIARAGEKEHGKVYGALLARLGSLQQREAALTGHADQASELVMVKKEREKLQSFAEEYQEYAKDKPDVRRDMNEFLRASKNPDSVLRKFGLTN